MSFKYNTDGSPDTFFHLNSVAAAMAASPGAYTVSLWFKKEAADTGNYSIVTVGTEAANNASLWAEILSGTTLQNRCRASGATSTPVQFANTAATWTQLTYRFSTIASVSGFASRMYVNGSATAVSAVANTSVAIDNLTFGAAKFASSEFGWAANSSFSYIGVWSGHLSSDNITLLQTLAPSLVDTGSLLWASDSELTQVAGSVSTAITNDGSDVTAQPDDNPDLITSLGGGNRRRRFILGY